MKNNSKKYWLFLVISSFLLSCDNEKETSTEGAKAPLMVEGYLVETSTFDNKFVTTANLMANEQVEVKAPISGQVLNINFKEGSTIRKGQSIVRLDDRSWKAQLMGLEAELEKSSKDYDRKKNLVNAGGSSEKDVQEAFATIERLKSEIRQLEINIDLANVRAPFSGTVGMRDFSLGAYLSQGDVITILTETEKLKVDFSLPSQYKNNLKIGKNITVVVEEDTLSAEIYAISPLINTDSRTIGARAFLNQENERTILPGTYAEVIVSIDSADDALLVPTQAIVPEINDQTVYLFKNGTGERKVVKTGNRNADMVHIVSGLSPGDTVITTGLLQIKQGMNLTLQNLQNKAK